MNHDIGMCGGCGHSTHGRGRCRSLPPVGTISAGANYGEPCACAWIYGLKPLDIVDDRSTQSCGCDKGAGWMCATARANGRFC